MNLVRSYVCKPISNSVANDCRILVINIIIIIAILFIICYEIVWILLATARTSQHTIKVEQAPRPAGRESHVSVERPLPQGSSSGSSSNSSPAARGNTGRLETWAQKDVQTWFSDNGLSHIKNRLVWILKLYHIPLMYNYKIYIIQVFCLTVCQIKRKAHTV